MVSMGRKEGGKEKEGKGNRMASVVWSSDAMEQ